jgi:phytoene/squalene synthetase
MRLGAAFQKINFLRDLNADYSVLGRIYFPGVDMDNFSDKDKKDIIAETEEDFKISLEGIRLLPNQARFGVYVAFVYYYQLFNKIKKVPAEKIMSRRIRIPNYQKFGLLCSSYLRYNFNMI